MRWFSIAVAISLVCPYPLQAGPASARHTPSAKPTPAEQEAGKSDEIKGKGAEDFDIPVPKGMPVHGIKVPHYDDKGKLIMILEADVANKLDDQHVEMENLKINAYDDDGKKIYIELPHAIFNLETRILTGDPRALIHREDFDITGNTIEFNTKTRHSTMRGNIKMTLLTADNPK